MSNYSICETLHSHKNKRGGQGNHKNAHVSYHVLQPCSPPRMALDHLLVEADDWAMTYAANFNRPARHLEDALNRHAPVFHTVVPYKGQLFVVNFSHSDRRPYTVSQPRALAIVVNSYSCHVCLCLVSEFAHENIDVCLTLWRYIINLSGGRRPSQGRQLQWNFFGLFLKPVPDEDIDRLLNLDR